MAGLRDIQQGSQCHRKTWINILFGILQLLLPCVQHGGAQIQALSQMSTSVVEVWQAEETDPLVPVQLVEERRTDSLPLEESSSSYARENGRSLRFEPPALEFGTQPLGLPRAETIYIHNPSQELPVTLLAMFTSSRHFHMPSFHRRVIPPRGKAFFKLVFLPTEEGSVENSLFINTSSHGMLSYQVFGVGVQPASLMSVQKDSLLIFPHIQSIKLTQTQEDTSNITILGLLLECRLPTSWLSQPQGSCLRAEETLSLHISLAESSKRPADMDKLKPYVIEHILVALVAPGAAGEALGGAITGEPKVAVYMLNSGGKKLYVKNMQLLSKVDATLEISQVMLQADTRNLTQVATLACRGSVPGQGGSCSSLVQVHLQAQENLTFSIFPGLHISHRRPWAELSSVLQVRQRWAGLVDLWLINPLNLPLIITHASLPQDTQGVLKMVNFSGPVTVPEGECRSVLSLQLLSRSLPLKLLFSLNLTTTLGLTLQLPLHLHASLDKQGETGFAAEGDCGRLCPLRLSAAGQDQWQLSRVPDSLSSSWAVDSQLSAELSSQWHSRKDQLPCRWPRIPVEPSSPLEFGPTPVNESKVKRLTLKNPSPSVVSMEICSLSLYPAPLEALDLLTKWFNISPLSVNISTTEFTLLASHSKEGAGVLRGEGVLRLLLQPWEIREVAVLFTPSEHKPTTTILLIRNNLTVFDMVTVRGHGAKELLRVGGKLPGPGASLRFNVPQSTLMDCRNGVRNTRPPFAIQKSFKVENAGELPLSVVSMSINGYKCQGFGFEVLQCRPFTLDHNTTSEITIAFTPDFTSSWVIRDLTLSTSRGSSFPFTLNVTLPHHMLPLCAQVVPGPIWEDTFWVATLSFTCFSLVGVCLMAFHQAQYILSEFSNPGPRNNHNPGLSRDVVPVNNITPNGVNKMKGSCKTYVDTCHTSDKGKGRGSPAVANGSAPRAQTSSKKSSPSTSSSTSSQPQKKHKVSVYYSKYKSSSSLTTATVATVTAEEEHEDLAPGDHTPDPVACINNNNNEPLFTSPVDKMIAAAETTTATTVHFKEAPQIAREDKGPVAVMFPMETPTGFPDNLLVGPGPRPGLLVCRPPEKECTRYSEKRDADKRDSYELEPRAGEEKAQKKKPEKAESSAPAGTSKGKKIRRRTAEGASGVPEHSVVMMGQERDKDPVWRTGDRNVNGNHPRNRCSGGKPDIPKPGPHQEHLIKQSGVCHARPRRRCGERRGPGVCESGSDSGSSSGSVRASRGSWGSWSSTSSMEGDKDGSTRTHCTTSTRKKDSMPYNMYPAERDCYQTMSSTHKTQSINGLYRKEPCQSPEPSVPNFAPSFAAVAAGMERNMDLTCQYVPEAWSAPSVPLTNEFRYNATEALTYAPQPPAPAPAPYNSFPWNSMNSQCNSHYVYNDQGNYMTGGNANFQNSFSCQESQSAAYSPQSSWSEDCAQEVPSSWDTAGCVGRKTYFPGTRSLSPMSSLFGSIWTPQSEPYQNHFQPDRSAPMSPVTPPHAPFNREPGGSCRTKQYFNPFGPHMNLDIWNSSSNRSSNSQLSNDSGYCGDV